MTRYREVKTYLLDGIQNKRWPEHERLPSENELVDLCQVSRMTARRAIKELEQEGLIFSVRGKGTFITPAKHQSSAVELRNIAEEIKGRQNDYHCKVLELSEQQRPEICQLFGPDCNKTYSSKVVHFENDQPIQLEYRHVNPIFAPDYLSLDLSSITANEYLMRVCPAHRVSHQIEAVASTKELKKHLKLTTNEPCLKLTRDTWYQGFLVSHASLYHPGSRYVLGTLFSLNSSEEEVNEYR